LSIYIFDSLCRVKMRCRAKTRNGKVCRRNATGEKYCTQHERLLGGPTFVPFTPIYWIVRREILPKREVTDEVKTYHVVAKTTDETDVKRLLEEHEKGHQMAGTEVSTYEVCQRGEASHLAIEVDEVGMLVEMDVAAGTTTEAAEAAGFGDGWRRLTEEEWEGTQLSEGLMPEDEGLLLCRERSEKEMHYLLFLPLEVEELDLDSE